MKPDWKDAPEWANWLYIKFDGYYYWANKRPRWSVIAGHWLDVDAISDLAVSRGMIHRAHSWSRGERKSSLEARP